MDFYTQVLNDAQRKLLPKLGSIFGNGSFYLAGGTALALQLGHRTSLDFDLYGLRHFNNLLLSEKIKQKFSKNTTVYDNQPKDTLFAEIMGVKFSIFYYPYSLLGDLKEYEQIKIASIEDIAAMKVAAIVQRGKQRDFVDIYFLIEKLGIDKIFAATCQKYPWYKDMNEIIFKSLTYFSDADNDKEVGRIKVLDPDFSWEKAKKKIIEEVRKYQEATLRVKLRSGREVAP